MVTPGTRHALAINRKRGGRMDWVANATEDRDTMGMTVGMVADKVGEMAGRSVDVVFANNDASMLGDDHRP